MLSDTLIPINIVAGAAQTSRYCSEFCNRDAQPRNAHIFQETFWCA